MLSAFIAAVLAATVGLLSAAPAPAVSTAHTDNTSTYVRDTTAYYTYDGLARLSSPSAATTDTRGSPPGPEAVSWGSSVVVIGCGVAANTEVPTVVFSRSRAPGIAGTFDDAVANGAPTQLNRVTGAARDANRRAAQRGQSPAPAGQSLDEYPFACSAQGGCGSTVRSVPVGEQSYQGGVLSRFFQNNGIGAGDPYNVTFGP